MGREIQDPKGGGDLVRHFAVVLASMLVAFLAAVVATVVDPQSADASTRVKSCTGGKIELKADEKRIFVLQNRKRDSKGLRRLCVHPKLQKIARSHSKDMIERDYFSHNTKGSGRTPEQRAKRAGYNYRYFGENISYGDSPGRVFDMWMKSDGHRKNILNGKFKEVGIGAKTGHFKPAGRTTTVYTVDFGTRL
jgi:uncharacterized protein YkwD